MYFRAKISKVRNDGKIMGGAMHYLSEGLREKNLAGLGGFLAGSFCLLCIGGSFGGGNAFQVVQSLDLIKTVIPSLSNYSWVYGALMSILVGLVIIGGIKSISACCIGNCSFHVWNLSSCLFVHLGTHFLKFHLLSFSFLNKLFS